MIRFLNIVACAALIGSAVYAYSIKYQTLYRSDQIAKMTRQIQQEKDSIGMQKAEWAHLVRPDRLGPLADKYLDLDITHPNQIVSFASLPERVIRGDEIARKLDALGLTTPSSMAGPARSGATTPSTATPGSGAR